MIEEIVRPSAPVSRLHGVSPESPYYIRNARVEPLAFVRALRGGSSPIEIIKSPPVRRWNDYLLQRQLETAPGPASPGTAPKGTIVFHTAPPLGGSVAAGTLQTFQSDPNPDFTIDVIVTFSGVSVAVAPDDPEVMHDSIRDKFNAEPNFSQDWVASVDGLQVVFTSKKLGSEWNGFTATVTHPHFGAFVDPTEGGADPTDPWQTETITLDDGTQNDVIELEVWGTRSADFMRNEVYAKISQLSYWMDRYNVFTVAEGGNPGIRMVANQVSSSYDFDILTSDLNPFPVAVASVSPFLPGAPGTVTPRGTLFGTVQHNDRLYCATEKENGDPSLIALSPGFDPVSWEGVHEEPARITATFTPTEHRLGLGSDPADYFVGYLFVPVSGRGEAGPWMYNGASGKLFDGSTSTRFFVPPISFDIPVSDETAYVDIYKTQPMKSDGMIMGTNARRRLFARTLVAIGRGLDVPRQEDFFYVGRAPVKPGESVAKFYDNTMFLDADIIENLEWKEGELSTGGQTIGTLAVPTTPVDRMPNMWAYAPTGATSLGYRSPSARSVSKDAGRVLYGHPSYPTKRGGDVYFRFSSENADHRHTIALVREYRVGDDKHYGQMVEYSDVTFIKVANLGEYALLVYVQDDGSFKLYERLTPDAVGGYVTAYKDDNESAPRMFAFDGEAFDASRLVDFPDGLQPTTYIDEPSSVILSAVNRPFEMSLDGFQMPDDRPVRLVTGLTASKAEATVRHTVLAVTDESVFVFRSDGESYVHETVTSSFGVELDQYGRPIHALTKNFPVLWTTSGRLAAVFGPDQFEYLDDPSRHGEAPLFTDVKGMSYDHREDELYISTDTGLWIYSFAMRGVVAQYNFSAPWVWFDQDRGFPLAQNPLAIAEEGVPGSQVQVLDESGATLPALFVTQRLWDGGSIRIDEVMVDFDEGVVGDSLPGPATMRHSVRHPQVNQWNEGDGNKITIEANVTPNRKRYLRQLKGGGHQVMVSGFKILRSLYLLARSEP